MSSKARSIAEQLSDNAIYGSVFWNKG